jgi:3-phosphoshikimate 1-carboxyvinyltransferase
LVLKKKPTLAYGNLAFNLDNTPDLAQPLITAMLGLKQPFEVHGLQTLPLKECDRIQALVDLAKAMGVESMATPSSITVKDYPNEFVPLNSVLSTREDHRVAMSLAPLSLLMPITIDAPDVVAKSYPDFWDQWDQFL